MKHLKSSAPRSRFATPTLGKQIVALGCLSLSHMFAPAVFAQDTESFEYDSLGRLVKTENLAAGTEIDYAYDAVGNRTQVAVNDGSVSSFSVNDVTVTEGGTATFTVTKAGATAQIHNVGFATSNNTATAGNDYSATSGTLAFGVSETAKTVSVTTTNDGMYELGESFSVNLSAPTNGASISDSQGIGAINDNDPASAFSVNNVSVSEGGALLFTVTKSGLTSQSHSITYATANGSAGASDYTGANGTLVFTSGQTAKTVSVSTTGDSIHETNETLYLNLSNPTSGATIADNQGVGTVNDNDAAPNFSVSNVTSLESQGTFTFSISKSGATSRTHAVSYATAPGTASTADYSSRSGTLTFTSGQTSQTVSVPITADTFQEPSEIFYLNLSSPTNSATVGDGQGEGTILDDDGSGCGQLCL